MSYTTDTERWEAVTSRDRAADGEFWIGVRSTGVFCRPGCPARTPLRKNVVFFDSLIEALRSGLRPCKRCRPLGTSIDACQADVVTAACRSMIAAAELPTLEQLAQQAELSPSHFQRLFTSVVGVSPAQFGRALRRERLQTQLPFAESVTRAASDAGYTSNAQFYDDARESLGMTPGAWKKQGEGERIRYAIVQCWLGMMLIAATDRGICRIAFDDAPEPLDHLIQHEFTRAEVLPADTGFTDLVERVVASLGTPEATQLPVDIRGTAFQARVWQALRQIPFGETVSYGELAERIGQPRAVRAVASACANNRVAVSIPCHRVVSKDGSLTGYAWGVERKRALLERESG